MQPFPQPRVWTQDELLADKLRAESLFTDRRREEGPRAYAAVYSQIQPAVADALAGTHDLLDLTAEVFLKQPDVWHVLRYCCAPPISEEDLWTMVGAKFRRVPADFADATAEALTPILDVVRFPWLTQRRPPSTEERRAAILATASIWASVVTGTRRRGDASARQETAVALALAEADFDFDQSRGAITVLDAMARGTYSRERKVAGAKCDLPVRLHDGRLLAIECKVSNGPKNSWKRLNREVGGKAERWRSAFGTQVVTGAVLAGVFDLSCLVAAQKDEGVNLFWEHDLQPLIAFLT